MQEKQISGPVRVHLLFKVPYKGKLKILRKTTEGNAVNYYRDLEKPKRQISFNVYTPGIYYFPDNCNIIFVRVSTKSTVKLPKFERNFEVPRLDEFTFDHVSDEEQKSPARVYKDQKRIVVNDTYNALPEQVQEAILQHELGHYKYATEFGADLYAAKMLQEKGGNLSQLFHAIALGCSKNDLTNRRLQILKNI